jgi:hypothetical protein
MHPPITCRIGFRRSSKFIEGLLLQQGLSIRHIGGHGIKGVGYRHDLRDERDMAIDKAFRVSPSIDLFVMVL